MKILLLNGELAPANQCYFSNHYNPKLNLESFYKDTDFEYFVSSLYCSGDTLKKEKWKEFFKDIGVEDKLRFIIWKDCYLSSNNEVIKIYFRNIVPNLNRERYRFQNFMFFPHRQYLSNFDFAKRFWNYINQHWDKYNLEAHSIVFINDKPQTVNSFFRFSTNYDQCIPCNDGNSHSSSEGIYSSTLKNIIGDSFLVSSCNLKKEIEKFIGLKQQLDLQDCFTLLDDVAEKYHHNKTKEENRLNLIYKKGSRQWAVGSG